MNIRNYVLNHDYGYGREPELKNLYKLNLRNIDDLRVYINDILNNAFINYQDNSLSLNNIIINIIIEE